MQHISNWRHRLGTEVCWCPRGLNWGKPDCLWRGEACSSCKRLFHLPFEGLNDRLKFLSDCFHVLDYYLAVQCWEKGKHYFNIQIPFMSPCRTLNRELLKGILEGNDFGIITGMHYSGSIQVIAHSWAAPLQNDTDEEADHAPGMIAVTQGSPFYSPILQTMAIWDSNINTKLWIHIYIYVNFPGKGIGWEDCKSSWHQISTPKKMRNFRLGDSSIMGWSK